MLNRRSFVWMAALGALAGCGSKFRTYNGPEVTRIVIYKGERKMHLVNGTTALKSYKIALGGNPIGDKQYEGDQRTPEGAYLIDRRNPNSSYHLSLGISYPNEQDVAQANAIGKSAGGDIFIHGRARKHRRRGKDWTAGCIAVKDREMEEVYSMVRVGTPIYILP
ncbi:L,D-transpeptidase family protein [Defluviimonas sp. WL0024]|uniref:L,D-transpeptidase family protein n=3 Tax=Albidovulum TaxID=205889 RepID=A0ABT3J179_9RHOB|nr:L,D-transpeptidase family protein [Defluviimonas salinarum]MCU9848129.1 L,D-transpeptidase family protein [Defluviimonas sp. WL0024]MCW3781441.1 L,D-transpeptidase family protein [Defluviimonas salinarum]